MSGIIGRSTGEIFVSWLLRSSIFILLILGLWKLVDLIIIGWGYLF